MYIDEAITLTLFLTTEQFVCSVSFNRVDTVPNKI